MSNLLLAPHQPATETAVLSDGHSPELSLLRLFPWDPIAEDLKETAGVEPLPWVKFPLGKVFATSGAIDLIFDFAVNWQDLLRRHQAGDWGEVDEENRKVNEEALPKREPLLSVYTITALDVVVWIITDADRSRTTLLTPSEAE